MDLEDKPLNEEQNKQVKVMLGRQTIRNMKQKQS